MVGIVSSVVFAEFQFTSIACPRQIIQSLQLVNVSTTAEKRGCTLHVLS